jgi:outer membrane immunogenic protein
MNRSLLATAAVLAAVVIAAPAFADEAPPTEVHHARHVESAAPAAKPAPAPTPSWTGTQVGGQGGISPMAQGFAEPGAYLFPLACGPGALCEETPFSFSGNHTSATGGGFLGYRIQFGTIVVGLEGDANAKGGSASYNFYDTNAFRSEAFAGSVSQSWDASIRARAGFLVTPTTLAYATIGGAFGSVSGTFAYSAHETGCLIAACASAVGGGSWSSNRSGLTGGAGVETMVTQALTVRLEYRYTDLGRFNEVVGINTVCAGVCSSPSSNALVSLHPTFQAVRVGVAYGF